VDSRECAWAPAFGAPQLLGFGRYPPTVEIPLSRDAHDLVENGECVGPYQAFAPRETAARVTAATMRFCTGISSGLGTDGKHEVIPL
jgi:hypothetical protein